MFSKLVNRFYYGKSGKGDYTRGDMPKNRIELFFTTLKVRFSALIRLNLIYFVVWLPMILVLMNAVTLWIGGLSTLNEMAANLSVDEIAIRTAEFKVFQHSLILRTLLYLVPCILITGPVTAGVSYDVRNWARDQHAFLWSDFKDALKENWKQALGISAITSVLPLLSYLCYYFYGQMARNNIVFYVPLILALLAALMWWLALTYFYFLIIGYKLKFKDVIRNGFLLAIARFPQTLIIKLMSLIPIAIGVIIATFVGIQWGMLVPIAFYFIIGFSLMRFIYASYAVAVFDKLLNPRIEGAPINMGLRDDKYNEIEEEIKAGMKEENAVYIEVEDDEPKVDL
ncbi:MAG: YesL family protein [Christensenellaceae bacterium]|nr:YesL family protein [Christensenellaceae bacterium]